MLSAFASVLAFCGVAMMGTSTQTVMAEETDSNITWLMTPTDDSDYEFDTAHNAGQATIGVEDYAAAPSGKVIHYAFDNRTVATTNGMWPGITVKVPCADAAEVTDFAGWVMWIEFNGVMSTNAPENGGTVTYAAFNFRNNSKEIISKDVSFVDLNGKITKEKPRWELFHCKYTEISTSGYEYSYEYSFAGYMVMPKECFNGGATLAAENTFRMSHDFKRVGHMDIKVGDVGYYTDYDSVVNELGRCTYSFVDHDGTVLETQSVRPGSTITAPEYSNTFTRGGKVYSFIGWSGYQDGMTISEDKTFTASYKVRDFHMIEGASIRTTANSSGIRFVAEFDENLYNEVLLDDNKEFGMLITKYDYYLEALEADDDLVTGLNALGNNKYIMITESSKNPLKPYAYVEESTTSYRINGAITNIQYSHADWKWIGVGVIITKDSAGDSYLYCAYNPEDVARTTAYVASAALNDPKEDFDTQETATLKNYVYKTAAKLSGESEETFNAAVDKTTYLSGYELEISGGLDTSYDFNKNVDGGEAYITIGEKQMLSAVVKNSNGNTLDVAYTLSVGDESVLDVDKTSITALKNGYSSLTMSCELFGYSETVTVYTGSENAGNRIMGSNTGAQGAGATKGEIAGKEYYWAQYDRDDGQQLYAAYTDISVYYIDYLISQGYKYLRVPFYFDTTRWEELGAASADQVTSPYFTIWMAKQLNGTSGGSSKKVYVPANEWCYYDMDLTHYRWNFTETDYAGVDTYGMKTKITDGGWYHYMNMKFSCAYGYVYTSYMTFLKSSTLELDESNDSLSFGENVTLSDWYNPNVVAKYTVDGVEMDSMSAINAEHNVTIKANIYTAKIGDGSYEIGTSAGWSIGCSEVEAVEKKMAVDGGIVDGATELVDVNGITTDVSLSAYSKAAALTEAGFDVTQTYVKRYSDGTTQTTDTVKNTERGIFYVNVSASKGEQAVEYDVTLDLYNSNEPVEYESFGHSDSSYAVTIYYALVGGTQNLRSYESLLKNYTVESGKAMSMSVGDGYVSLEKYGVDTKLDKTNSAAATVYGGDPTGSVYYLAIDQSKILPEGPLVQAMGTGYASINIYVTPRHSKAYYEEFAKSNTGLLKYAYAQGWTSGQAKAYRLVSVKNVFGDVSYKGNESANWQSSAYTSQTITLATIIDNYDGFYNRDYPIYISEDPQGRSTSVPNNGVMKLSSLIF